jgi:predicted acylesterase/phospholipase RssA
MDKKNEKKKHNLTSTGGGARVVPSLVGAILFFEMFDIEPELLVGVSGGFLPLLLWRAGYSGRFLARLMTETTFSSKLIAKTSIFGWLKAELLRRVWERTLPTTGILDSGPLGQFFADLVLQKQKNNGIVSADAVKPKWPSGCVTVAAATQYLRRVTVVFTDKGVCEQKEDGSFELLSNNPADVEFAVRATTAIPGFIEQLDYKVNNRHLKLFDGGFTSEGPCVVSPITGLFGHDEDTIIVFNVGAEETTWLTKLQDLVYKFVCAECYIPKAPDGHTDGLKVIAPKIRKISSVGFKVKPYRKLSALMAGFEASLQTFEEAGLLCEEDRLKARSIVAEARALHRRTWWTRWCFCGTLRTRWMKELLARRGMYEMAEGS